MKSEIYFQFPLGFIQNPALKLLLALLMSLGVVSGRAQFAVKPSASIAVVDGEENSLRFPWTGGLNAVEISTFDADFDGLQDDLYIYDKAGSRNLVFIGGTLDGNRVYDFSPALSNAFPPLQNWVLLRDYDCDGRKDIFTYSTAGGAIAVYRNVGGPASGLSWELVENVLLSFYDFGSTSYTTNVYCSSQDLPAIFDYDGDGDLDIITANVGGSFLEFHFNQSMESGAGCGLDHFELANRCYGGFLEGSETNDIILDPDEFEQACTFNVTNPKRMGGEPVGGPRHVGTTVLAFDANADGLADLVLGDAGYSNLVYLQNSDGPDGLDQITDFDMEFPSDFDAPPLDLDQFPAAFYEDVSGDGIPDLLVSPNQPVGSANHNSVYYYPNLGAVDAPIFGVPARDFLQGETLDFGEFSSPAIFDQNGDGLQDLVIASRGKYLAGSYAPILILLTNTGTGVQPAYEVTDDNWLDISEHGLAFPHPAFGDLDADGLPELLVGTLDGTIHRFTNIGDAGISQFEYTGPLNADGTILDVGNFSTPQLFDLDGDGDLDILVGNEAGDVQYYENIGSASTADFTLETSTLGGISTLESPPFFTGHSSPFAYTFEGETYLVCGSKSGNLFLYGNIDGNTDGIFDLLSTQAYGAYLPAHSVPTGRHSTPWVWDANNDGFMDLVSGGIGGGLEYFKGYDPDGIHTAGRDMGLHLRPNPVQNVLHISVEGGAPSVQYVEIRSSTGREVQRLSPFNGTLDVRHLAGGLYVLRVYFADGTTGAEKFVKSNP